MSRFRKTYSFYRDRPSGDELGYDTNNVIYVDAALAKSDVITVPSGSSYTTIMTISSPVASGKTTFYGFRAWHRSTSDNIRRGEQARIYLDLSGSNYTLNYDDMSATSVTGSAPSLTDAFDSGTGWKVRISTGSLLFEILQTANPRYVETWVWKTEESSV